MTIKLLCLPCAGASATMYLRWKQQLPNWIEVIPLELAGRGERLSQAHITEFSVQVSDIFVNYRHYFKGKYVIFGHSMGGLLAFELVKYFESLDKDEVDTPQALFVSACPAPTKRNTERFSALDDASLIDDLKKQNGTPAVVFEHKELLTMVVENLRADYKVCASYHHDDRHKIQTALHVFAGKDDEIETCSINAWQEETLANFSINWFEGNHFYLQESQSEKALLSCLVKSLESHVK